MFVDHLANIEGLLKDQNDLLAKIEVNGRPSMAMKILAVLAIVVGILGTFYCRPDPVINL